MVNFEDLKHNFNSELSQTSTIEDIYNLKSAYIGKTGKVTSLFKGLSNVANEEKKHFGQEINLLKNYVELKLTQRKELIDLASLQQQLADDNIDITLPSREKYFGKLHPITYVLEEITSIFKELGFTVADGPEVELSHYNFNALNIPDHHPAREMHDTFYIDKPDYLLRTHTSSVQIRTLLKQRPPIKMISPGRTYRSDSDSTHTPMFHQVEALYLDKGVNFAELRYCINEFLRRFFQCEIKTRFRTSYFPFTEPSAEVDIACTRKDNKIIIGQGNEYMEIMGCGMVHSNVLKNCQINPDEYQGFALGLGVERLAMLKYGIADLRDFFQNDPRFLDHYSFNFEV
ncbi:MAG: phenylalanine--tRNA ligase subunit alpha [Rickettsiales bacterium]|jgi:phenylalanyl-tRNA synthetase alpha chain|nr:phenylalanine--tRNA ligase subunit alpha [Rickettsiales bacterium]